jgi:hypothetical protein
MGASCNANLKYPSQNPCKNSQNFIYCIYSVYLANGIFFWIFGCLRIIVLLRDLGLPPVFSDTTTMANQSGAHARKKKRIAAKRARKPTPDEPSDNPDSDSSVAPDQPESDDQETSETSPPKKKPRVTLHAPPSSQTGSKTPGKKARGPAQAESSKQTEPESECHIILLTTQDIIHT